MSLSQIDWVEPNSIQIVSKEEAYRQVFDDENMASDLDSINPFLDIIIFNMYPHFYTDETIAELEKKILTQSNVSNLIYENSHVKNIEQTFNKVKLALGIMSLLLVLMVIVLLHNVIRMMLLTKTKEIKIMELVGATSDFIRRPFITQAVKSGAISAGLASVLLVLTIFILGTMTGTFDVFLRWHYLLFVIVILFIIGFTVSIISTYIIVNIYLKGYSKTS
jgi:cell division transport system permease protein